MNKLIRLATSAIAITILSACATGPDRACQIAKALTCPPTDTSSEALEPFNQRNEHG